MDLTQILVGFPVLRIETRVFHSTPRSPTAFERVLLRVCDRFSNDATYNNISLERIFADFLGVANPALVVGPTIQELVFLDVLRCQGDVAAMDTLILRDLEITDRGRQLMSEDKLPDRSQESEEIFFYDPVKNRLLTAKEIHAYRSQVPTMPLDASVFEEVFPEEQIRTQILTGEYSWRSAASRVERIERQSVSVQWRDTPATITIEHNILRVAFKDAGRTAYVNTLSAEEVQRRWLGPTFGGEQIPAETLEQFPLVDIEAANGSDTKWIPFPRDMNELSPVINLWIVDRAVQWLSYPAQAKSHQVIICFDPSRDSDEIQVKWNESRDGCFVEVKGAYPLDDVILASSQYMVRGRRVRVKIGQEVVELPLALRCSITGMSPGISDSLVHIGAALRQRETDENALVPALWQSEADFWRETLERMKANPSPLKFKIERLQNTRRRYLDIIGKMNPEIWDNAITGAVCEWLKSSDAVVSLDELDDIIALIAQCTITSPDCVAKIVQSVIARLQVPLNLAEFGEISASLMKGGPAWQIPFPSRLYTPEVFKAIAQAFPEKRLLSHLSNDNEFDKGIRQLLQTFEVLNNLIGSKGIQGLLDEGAFLALLKSSNAAKISEQAEAWRNHYNAFCEMYREMEPFISGSELATMNERIQRILMLTRKLVGGLDPRFHSVFVIDTSALLERPQIMKIFRPDDYIVVSKRVIEELDDKKRDESLRPKVAEVTRALQSFPRHQIQFCDGDMSLLAPDYRRKGDNLILSVAVRYRKHRPILLTNDNNLTLKAKAEDISAMSVDEFEKRPRQALRTPTQLKGLPQNKGGNSRHPNPRRKS